MCFGANQPEPPINRPSYGEEDMDKNFSMSMTDVESGQIVKEPKPFKQATMRPAVTGTTTRKTNVL